MFKKGQRVKVTDKAIKEWKASGAWHWMFNGTHEIAYFNGTTVFTTENLGIKSEDDLELII